MDREAAAYWIPRMRGGMTAYGGAAPVHDIAGRLERFQAKWIPVRVKKTVENKNLEPRSDSLGTEKALKSDFAGILLLVLRFLAADGLQLGEDGVDIEIVALFLRRLGFRLLAGGLGGRQQGGAALGGIGRLFLGRPLHLEVEFDLRAQAERHRVHRRQGRGVPVGAVAHAGDGGL